MRPSATSRTLSRAIKSTSVLSLGSRARSERRSGRTPEVTPDTFDSTCNEMVASKEIVGAHGGSNDKVAKQSDQVTQL